MMRIWLIALLLIAVSMIAGLPGQAPVPLDERRKTGEVVIQAVTAAGDRLPDGVTIRIAKDGQLMAEVTNERTLRLPYGKYEVDARTRGAYPVKKELVVYSSTQTLPLCFFVAPIELPEPDRLVRGRISDESKVAGCLWVRLLSAFGDGVTHDATASSTGFFSMQQVRPGVYLAVSIGPRGLCDQAHVRVSYGPSYTRDLKIEWTRIAPIGKVGQ